MRTFLIGGPGLLVLFILGIAILPFVVLRIRSARGAPRLDLDGMTRLLTEIATALPVGTLLWNIFVFGVANSDAGGCSPITFGVT